jgi:hypothetical protein
MPNGIRSSEGGDHSSRKRWHVQRREEECVLNAPDVSKATMELSVSEPSGIGMRDPPRVE